MSGTGIYIAIGGFTLFFLVILAIVGLVAWLKSRKPQIVESTLEPARIETPRQINKARLAYDLLDDAKKDIVSVKFCEGLARVDTDQLFQNASEAHAKRQARRSPKSPSQSPNP